MKPRQSGKRLSSFLQSERRDLSSTPSSPLPAESFIFNSRERGSMAQWSTISDSTPSTAMSSPISSYTMSPWSMSPMAMKTPLPNGKSHGCIASMVRLDGLIYAIAAAGELLYTGSESKNIRIWKHPSFGESGCLKSGSGSVKALLVVGEKIFSAHRDHKIRVWQRSAGTKQHRRLATLPTLKDHVQKCINPKNYVQVRRHRRCVWIKHVDAISSLACDEERGLLYSGSWDKTVKVWRMSDFKCVESIDAHDDAVNAVAVGHDGSLLTGSADGTVKMWTLIPGRAGHVLAETLQIGQRSTAVNALAVAAGRDGFLYAGSSDGVITYWDKPGVCGSFRGHKLAILCLATARSLIFSGSADKTVGIWRREAGGLHLWLAVLEGHAGPVKCISATLDVALNDRCVVYTGGLDRSVKVWSVALDQNAEDNHTGNPVLSPAWVHKRATQTPKFSKF